MTAAQKHDDAWYRARLAEPAGRLRVVIDTDAANEIDDQFALSWALLSPAQLDVLAVYAAPYSFEHRRQELVRAQLAREHPDMASEADRGLLRRHADRLDHFARRGWRPQTLEWPIFDPPAVGTERSHDEILRVFDALGMPAQGRVFRGSAGYLADAGTPLRSAAVDHLIDTARASSTDDRLFVVAIGCPTNIACALRLAPDIVEKIVVVWTSGYPSHAPHVNHSFNLEQDLLASTVLLDSGVPLVYLPGFHVGAQLRLSLAEVDRHVTGRGRIGHCLHHLFTHNPLWDWHGVDPTRPHSWVIWDMINIAWLIDPAWVPSEITATPVLGADRRWDRAAGRHPMREAHAVARDAIFGDFFSKLEAAPG